MIHTLLGAEKYFSAFITKAPAITGKDITAERMWPLLKKIGNPHEKLQVVHIAGTSGKTSTAYFTAALLSATGKKVGLTISPHVSRLNERLQVDGQPLSESIFCKLVNEFIDQIGDEPDASYFELLIVFVIWAFNHIGVDYAVLETGLGGLHDSTNVCRRSDKVCIITDIGLDHQHVLGNTIAEIASQKAGIIHEQNHVFMLKQTSEVEQVIVNKAKSLGAIVHVTEQSQINADTLGLVTFQKRNWTLAKVVFDFIAKRDNLTKLSTEKILDSQVQVPGRMQLIVSGYQTFILDGAHNEQKMQAFVKSFQDKFANQKVPVMLGMKRGKEYLRVIEILSPITSEIICVGFEQQQDMPIHSINPKILADASKRAGIGAVKVADSLEHGIQLLNDSAAPLCIVTGSFYMLGGVLKIISESRLHIKKLVTTDNTTFCNL